MTRKPTLVPGNDESNKVDLDALDVLNWSPAQLTSSERLMLFTLIYSLRPSRYLEIGTYRGGSALIVSAAMDAVPYDGRIVCLDFKPQVDPDHWDRIQHRSAMVVGYFEQEVGKAEELTGTAFDFIFIDADHREESVFRDAVRSLSLLAEGGYLLFHDSYNQSVRQAADDFSLRYMGSVSDFGVLTRACLIHDVDSARIA